MWPPSDQRLAAESAKIIGRLAGGVGRVPHAADQLDQLAVVEAVEGMREKHQRRQQRHKPGIADDRLSAECSAEFEHPGGCQRDSCGNAETDRLSRPGSTASAGTQTAAGTLPSLK